MADRYLYRLRPVGFDSIELEEGEATMFNELDASTREERHVKVASFLPGFTGEGDTGFSSRDVAKRRVAMYRLYCIMLSWDGMPGMHRSTHQCAEDLSSNRVSNNDSYPEYLIAYHFVATFADFFKRAPVLPHIL